MSIKTDQTVEQELLEQTKLKTRQKEGRQAYLKRVYEGCELLYGDDNKDADTNWEKISEAAQGWYKKALKAVDSAGQLKDADLPDFSGAPKEDKKPEPAAAAPEKESTDVASKEKSKKVNGKTKAAAPEKAKTPKKASPRAGGGKVSKIVEACFTNPGKTVDELNQMLTKKGVETSPATIWSVRTGLVRACAYLHGAGKLKENPFTAEG